MDKKKIKVASVTIGLSCLIAAVYIPMTNAFANSETTLVSENVITNSDVNDIGVAVPLSEKVVVEDSSNNSNFTEENTDTTTVKAEIWHKMLNSIDYYSSVSGKMVYTESPNEEIYIEYQTNLDESESYTKIEEVNVSDSLDIINGDFSASEDNDTFGIEVFTSGDSLITLDNLNKIAVSEAYSVFTRENSAPIEDNERVIIEEDGTLGYYYRCDVTNTYLASASLFPQEMTFGFLTDFDLWNVDSVEEYVGRECYVISGETSTDYGNKIGVKEFQLYVDCETGVLLKYIGYDELGNVYAYLVTEEIEFGNDEFTIYKPSTVGYEFID